jgi:hypothetical protein
MSMDAAGVCVLWSVVQQHNTTQSAAATQPLDFYVSFCQQF